MVTLRKSVCRGNRSCAPFTADLPIVPPFVSASLAVLASAAPAASENRWNMLAARATFAGWIEDGRSMTTDGFSFTLSRMATPIGEMQLVTDERGLLRALDWSDHEERMRELMRRQYPGRAVRLSQGAAPDALRGALDAYFAGALDAIDAIEVETGGTDFQKQAWAALRTIPAGQTTSYSEQAARIGRPTAVRAVGLATGATPVGLVVPCHRVIGADGSLTGYGGGLERKRWLLDHEGVRLAGVGRQAVLF
jgi:methylated-DNA-[protein]-cysteine S-methyltransferase